MKKIIVSSVLLLLLFGFKQTHGQRVCASTFNPADVQKSDNQRYQRYLQLEQHILNYRNSLTNGIQENRLIGPNSIIIIPVVVHVIHDVGEPIGIGRNIGVAQVQSQIDVLNEDFRRLNPDNVNTPNAFQGVAADPNIEFRLACIDPNGNITDGITRTESTVASFTGNDNIKFNATGGHDAWPTNQYLNMWVGNLTPGLLGYAQFPIDYSTNPTTDGVVIRTTAFGRVGNVAAPYNTGRTATHEIGHWLGLFHIWGDDGNACSGSDQCDDTPNQADENYGCLAFPTPSCGNAGDMSMNYMDYSDDACMNIFTNDQRIRMRAIFTLNGIRASFIDNYFRIIQPTAAICATGTVTVRNPNCLVVTWSVVSGPATIVGGQGTNTVTLQSSGNGTVVLRATAGGYIDEKNVHIGPPIIGSNNPPLQYWFGNPSTGYNNVCNAQTFYTNMPVAGATSVVWTRTAASPSNTNWSQSGNNLNFYFWAVGQTAVFRINASNGCGSVTNNFGFKSINCGGGGGGGCSRYQVSPNPASGSLRIIVPNIPPPCDLRTASKSKESSTAKWTITEIRLYDNSGNLKQVRKEKGSRQVTIDLTGFTPGVYLVEIGDGSYKERQMIIIQ